MEPQLNQNQSSREIDSLKSSKDIENNILNEKNGLQSTSEKIDEEGNPVSFIDRKDITIIYILLLLLFFLCCTNNYIINKKKEPEKIEYYGKWQQIGRIIGIFTIILYFFFFKKNFEKIKWFIFHSILLKAICLLINSIINNDYIEWISIIFQGLFHSFIDIYFPIWINHFIKEECKLFLLSISRTSSFFGFIIGLFIAKDSFSFEFCYFILSIVIIILDFIFIFIVNKCLKYEPEHYFNLTVTKDEKGLPEKCSQKSKNCIEKMQLPSLKSNFSLAFFCIVLVRAIYKLSFLGTSNFYKGYYDKELEGNVELNDKIKYISLVPLLFLIFGVLLSCFDCYIKYLTFIISICIGIFGSLASLVKDKSVFVILLILFHGSSNLIVPSVIQKSFDCYEDKQLAEIFYVINCLIYSCINIFSFFPKKMILYLNLVWINCILFLIYECRIKSNNKRKNKNKSISNSTSIDDFRIPKDN